MTEGLKDRLTKARAAMGWTQHQLAEASGVAAAQISRYESGRSEPRFEVIAKLAKALDVQFDWLARGIGSVEGGEPHRKMPSGMETMPIDLSDEELDQVVAYAKLHKITKEMAVRKLFLEGFKALLTSKEIPDESVISDLQVRLLENKELVEDLRVRLEQLERSRKP
jgi:transcriptional regulator with XRE-family HTH domain